MTFDHDSKDSWHFFPGLMYERSGIKFDALNADRFHHAWLLTGPRGVGKATLAWRMARHLLTAPLKSDAGLFGDGNMRGILEPIPKPLFAAIGCKSRMLRCRLKNVLDVQ